LSFDSVDPDPEITSPNVGTGTADEAGNRTAQQAGARAQAATTQTAQDMVSQFQQTWGPHYAALQNERLRKINELAAKDSYDISLQISSGKKFVNPLTGEEEDEYEDRWEKKTYKRKKVNERNWALLEEMKGEYAKELDQAKRAKLYARMHEGMAYLYLGMKPDEFARTDWEEIKLILDACNHRTRHGLPNTQTPSRSSSTSVGLG
jgi:hypothetical protein